MKRAGLLVVLVLLASSAGTLADPDGDRQSRDFLGWEGGHWYDDPIAVTVADGLNATEREAVTSRAMARTEHIRDREFVRSVSVTLQTRLEYRAASRAGPAVDDGRWNNQVWKALFLVGDDRDAGEVISGTFGSSIAGYYRPGTGEIVLVSDSPTPSLSRGTLVHELVHALQDQHFGLGDRPATQDAQLARNGLVEGEANYLQGQYERRCGETWDCIDPSVGAGDGSNDGNGSDTAGDGEASDDAGDDEAGDGDTGDDASRSRARIDDGVFLVIYHPYVTGPSFVDRVVERGGTDAVDRLHDDYPASTEQLIHPEAYPDEEPVNVTVPDRSGEDWRRFDREPVADTVGEASIYAMVVDNELGPPPEGRYSYDHPISAGWGGDSVVPYRNGSRNGYVWETVWDTDADAREFHGAYRDLLDRHGATAVADGRYEIPPDYPYGGAYRVTRDGRTVRIVHGPTLSALDRIHEP